MPLLEIAWFETVVAVQRDRNLPPEGDGRRVASPRLAEEAAASRQPRQAANPPTKPPPR